MSWYNNSINNTFIDTTQVLEGGGGNGGGGGTGDLTEIQNSITNIQGFITN